LRNVTDYLPDGALVQLLPLEPCAVDKVQQVPVAGVLHENVDVLFDVVVKAGMEGDYVGVVDGGEDLGLG